MIAEKKIRELIARFKRDAGYDMGDDSMIAATIMEYLLAKNAELTKQRAELLEACKAFLRYDQGDQEDGVALMISYNEAVDKCLQAVDNCEG